MDPARFEITMRETLQFAHGWRHNWEDFSGPELLRQFQGIKKWADGDEPDHNMGSDFHLRRLMASGISALEALDFVERSGGRPSEVLRQAILREGAGEGYAG